MQRQVFQNNIFNNHQRQDNSMNYNSKYNKNNILGNDEEIDEMREENNNYINKYNKSMNKQISNEKNFNNVFGPL